MHIKNIFVIFMIYLSSPLFAAQSNQLFTIMPITTIPLAVISGQHVIVEYKVTNNTSERLSDNYVEHLSSALQIVSKEKPSICKNPFSLASHASCILILQINADAIQGSLTGGPTVCNTASKTSRCSSPTLQQSLNVKKLPASEVKTEKIVLMRHGEKPEAGLGQLNCQGLNRALALPRILNRLFGKPDYIFAPAPSGAGNDKSIYYGEIRPFSTIEPAAIQYGKTVSVAYTFTNDTLVAAQLTSPRYHSSLIFVAWEHVNIPLISKEIMRILGHDPLIIPEWPSYYDFDTFYIFTIVWYKGVPAISFEMGHENLNGQSTECPISKMYIAQKHVKDKTEISASTKVYFVPVGYSAEITSNGQLNCYGLNRSLGLIERFKQNKIFPDNFYAPEPTIIQYKNNYDYLAGFILDPTAIAQTKPLYMLFGYTDNISMANYLLSFQRQNQTLAVAWDVYTLPGLLELVYNGAGGTNFKPPTIDANLIYLIDFNFGTPVLSTIPQNLKLSDQCPQPIVPISR